MEGFVILNLLGACKAILWVLEGFCWESIGRGSAMARVIARKRYFGFFSLIEEITNISGILHIGRN